MKGIWSRSALGLAALALIMALLLFLPAWSLGWWQAWLYWLIFLGASLLVTLYFLRRDPDLIERRLKAGPAAEQQTSQQIIQSALSLVFAALLLVPGFDHRLHWSAVPLPVALVADAFVVAGFWIIFRVFSENSHASNTVRVEFGQEVISVGAVSVGPPPHVLRRNHPVRVHATGARVVVGVRAWGSALRRRDCQALGGRTVSDRASGRLL